MRNRPEHPDRRRAAFAAVLGGLLLPAACGAPPAPPGVDADRGDAATATSAEVLGGMDALIEAAQAEGELNVVTPQPDRVDYGEMISAFEDKYDIKVNPASPDDSGQEGSDAVGQDAGADRAPDVFDLGQAVAPADADERFAAYRVETWDDIADDIKHPDGRYVGGYTGFMSIGYDAGEVPAPTGVGDLLGGDYRGKVALNGDPTRAGAAFSGVVMAALGNGGGADDVEPGVDFFAELDDAGNLLPVDPTPATIASGETPVVIDWDHANARQAAELEGEVDWRVVVPEGAVVSSYCHQAIDKDAPHPAAARLWQEFVFSDEGQGIYLDGFARPARARAMEAAGTIDAEALAALPEAEGEPVALTGGQRAAADRYLAENWADAVS
ncbi:ABC transporter substrate-binding protein [Actinorugispora endophytica]|uniref:ABC transporter substrate-binding protein n=1 Tax=Actinorugispora endophytica TaxID=1605990 RepID=UPI001AAD4D22|nr:extracellular solute-binding protein [Actinorugispora endophytica]